MRRRRIDQQQEVARTAGKARGVLAAFARAVGSLAVAALVVYGLVAGYAWLKNSERFQVRQIVFTGVRETSDEELSQRGGLARGANIFSVDLADAARRIEQDPWVAHARIARDLPDTLRIAIDERKAVALVSVGGLYAVDEAGALFKRVLAGDHLDLPVITGLARDSFQGERRGIDPALRTALGVVQAFGRHPMAERAPLSELSVRADSGETTFVAFVGDEPVEVRLGALGEESTQADAVAVLDRLVRVWDELERRGAHARFIDLGNRLRPEWVAAKLE